MSRSSTPGSEPRISTEEFVQLFTQTQRSLYLFILAQVGNTHRAEEILQETNLVLWAKLGQFRPGTDFLSWSRQIATFEILKSRQRYRRERLTFSEEFMQSVAEEVVTLATEEERRREALQFCLEKLPASDRALIEQRYEPGASGKDIAVQLGRPLNSVHQSLGRIRRLLLECIQRQLAAEVGT